MEHSFGTNSAKVKYSSGLNIVNELQIAVRPHLNQKSSLAPVEDPFGY